MTPKRRANEIESSENWQTAPELVKNLRVRQNIFAYVLLKILPEYILVHLHELVI